ncbi:hypothetical protein HK101_006344 [Irineochytrium annulatum]|nr:hypothetical protein HK101_006344 [Irineochytrium annulatum]
MLTWFPETEAILEHGVGPWFAIAGLLSGIQLTLWESDHLVLSLIVLIFAIGSISLAYYHVNTSYPAQSLAQSVLVHAPISMFHGWLVFLLWINVMAIFTTVQQPAHPDVFHSVLAGLILLKLAATASSYTEWRHETGDVAGASVIAWGLLAISAEQDSVFIKWFSFILAIYVIAHGLFRPAQRHFVKAREEQEPLLGA